MVTIAVYNLKGGVGKTATAVNLAYLAAQDGYPTLLWDFDPQASTSFYYNARPKIKGSIKKLIGKDNEIDNAISSTEYERLDIIPADISARHIDVILDGMKGSKKQLKQTIKQLEKEYELLLIDTPPGISLLSENIFEAADHILVPTIPTTLSLRTLEMIEEHFKENGLDKGKLIPFFSMVDLRKTLHQEILQEYSKKKQFLRQYIPYASDVEKMGLHQAPVNSFANSTKAGMAFNLLWKGLKRRIF